MSEDSGTWEDSSDGKSLKNQSERKGFPGALGLGRSPWQHFFFGVILLHTGARTHNGWNHLGKGSGKQNGKRMKKKERKSAGPRFLLNRSGVPLSEEAWDRMFNFYNKDDKQLRYSKAKMDERIYLFVIFRNWRKGQMQENKVSDFT
jgi:hypothetical protein